MLLYEQNAVLKSVSLKIEPLLYIAIYYNGSIFNETGFRYKKSVTFFLSVYRIRKPLTNLGGHYFPLFEFSLFFFEW